ncbi:membrane protein [hydrothermal vent metagenome]|uniref:Membrane protein n=1 Tax=hydrothermal vent metagenome TaxID=652676 RepID=A0A1W1BYY5_9ZZZZ
MENIFDLLASWGYLIVAFYSFGGGMLALAGAGILASMGKMDIGLAIAIAIIFNFIGDAVLFYMGQNNKKDVKVYLDKFKGRIHARTILLMRKYGWAVVFLQKYLYGIKTLVPIIMGLSKYDFRKFIILNVFASIVWGLVVGLLSYYFSSAVQNWLS